MDRETHLLIGGLGFIGYHLATLLVDEDISTIILARKSTIEKRKRLYDLVAGKVRIAILDDLDLSRFIEEVNPDVIYHLAGKPGGPSRIQREAHVDLLLKEIDAATTTDSRIVYFSSIAVAADIATESPGSIVTEETAPPSREADFKTIHSETKALGEYILSNSSIKKWSILRPGLVFGPQAPHIEWKLIRTNILLWIKPVLDNVPVVNVLDVANIAFRSGEGSYDGKWLHVVADTIKFDDVINELCKINGRRRCLKIPVSWLAKLGAIMPRTSPLRLSWSIISKKYIYKSIYLKDYQWKLTPVL